MTVSLNKSRGKWCFDFWLNGQRHQGYCVHPETRAEARSKKEARDIEALYRAQLQRPAAVAIMPGCSLAEAVSYFSTHTAQHLKEWPTMRPRLQELLAFFGADRDVCSIDEIEVDRYVEWSRQQTIKVWRGGPAAGNDNRQWRDTGRPRSARTVNDYLRLLLRVLRAPPARKFLKVPPEVKFMKVAKRKPSPIDQRVAERIIAHAAEHLQRVIVLAVNTGMRETEILKAHAAQYNADQAAIYLIENTKARTGRLIPLNDIAAGVVKACMVDGDKLWEQLSDGSERSRKYKLSWGIENRGDIPLILFLPRGKGELPRPLKKIDSSWKSAKRRAGIGGRVRFHDTRASFCSYLAAEGADPYKIQKLAGHKDITTTMLYVEAGSVNLHETVALLSRNRPLRVPDKSPLQADKAEIEKAVKPLKSKIKSS